MNPVRITGNAVYQILRICGQLDFRMRPFSRAHSALKEPMNTMETTRCFRVQLFILAAMLPFFVATALFAQDPPGRVGRLSYVGGSVSLQPAGETQWSAALLNYPIAPGDRLYTDQGARADL